MLVWLQTAHALAEVCQRGRLNETPHCLKNRPSRGFQPKCTSETESVHPTRAECETRRGADRPPAFSFTHLWPIRKGSRGDYGKAGRPGVDGDVAGLAAAGGGREGAEVVDEAGGVHGVLERHGDGLVCPSSTPPFVWDSKLARRELSTFLSPCPEECEEKQEGLCLARPPCHAGGISG